MIVKFEGDQVVTGKSPKNEGRAACIMLRSTGVCGARDSCKYPEGSLEREEWMVGWDEVYDEVKRQRLPLWEEP